MRDFNYFPELCDGVVPGWRVESLGTAEQFLIRDPMYVALAATSAWHWGRDCKPLFDGAPFLNNYNSLPIKGPFCPSINCWGGMLPCSPLWYWSLRTDEYTKWGWMIIHSEQQIIIQNNRKSSHLLCIWHHCLFKMDNIKVLTLNYGPGPTAARVIW